MQVVKKFIPIIVPQKYYVDQYGHPNAFHENNISLYITDHKVIILIRQVNYRKFHNKNYIVGHDKSLSEYVMLSGPDFDHLKYQEMIYDWNDFPAHPAYWKGMDDIRFITDKLILPIISERNEEGKPCLFLADLNNHIIKITAKLDPHVIEKNWMPYIHHDEIKVIYSVSPFVIKSLMIDNRKIINDCQHLKGYHGSTNGIAYHDGYLFIIHLYQQFTVHRWLYFNPDTLEIKVSEPFRFFEHSFIEFNCSLCWYQNDIIAALAVNETQVMLSVIDPTTINLI